jgi:hypothetical protein
VPSPPSPLLPCPRRQARAMGKGMGACHSVCGELARDGATGAGAGEAGEVPGVSCLLSPVCLLSVVCSLLSAVCCVLLLFISRGHLSCLSTLCSLRTAFSCLLPDAIPPRHCKTLYDYNRRSPGCMQRGAVRPARNCTMAHPQRHQTSASLAVACVYVCMCVCVCVRVFVF